ncbi:MAG: MMPL family transporter, partial [Limisphaerales bacterium]
NLNSLFTLINAQFLNAQQTQNAENQSLVKALPALERIITQATAGLRRAGTPPSPGITALFGAGQEAEHEMYITFNAGKIFLVTAQARDEKKTGASVERLRQLVWETQDEVPGLNVGITGEPILEYDEMAQSQRDSTLASIVSLVLCAGIFIYSYREMGRPLKATFCLIIGLGYTMAFTTLVVGHLNILTITFAPILIGLAIDFGVHLITRYEEELRRGETTQVALERAMAKTGLGICTGAFTTAGAFFAMAGTDFKGIQEMGIICGGGMLLCLIPMMTLLPVLLLRGEQKVSAEKINQRVQIEKFLLGRPVLIAVATIIFCALAVLQFGKVYFDYNLLHMQSKDLPAVVFEQKLINSPSSAEAKQSDKANKSLLYAAVIATNLSQAGALEAKIKTLPTVAGVDSMSQYLTENQTAKL